MRTSIEFIKNKLGNNLIGVEIGVEAGLHAFEVNKCLDIRKFYLVDIWGKYKQETGFYNYEVNYERVKKKFKNNKNVFVIKGKSIEIANRFTDNSLDFVYIDANHQYEYVRNDIEFWTKKVKINGYVCGHDYFDKFPGVIKATNEFVKKYNYKLFTKKNKPISADWWFKKERR